MSDLSDNFTSMSDLSDNSDIENQAETVNFRNFQNEEQRLYYTSPHSSVENAFSTSEEECETEHAAYLSPNLRDGMRIANNKTPFNENARVRQRPHKFAIYTIVKKMKKRQGSLKKFKRDHWHCYTGSLKYIRRLSVSTLKKWNMQYKDGSEQWEKLRKFIHVTPKKIARETFFFKTNHEKASLGFLPILETYLLLYRKQKAEAHQFRSMKWLLHAANSSMQNIVIRDILTRKMGKRELEILSQNNYCVSKGWIRRVMQRHSLNVKKPQSSRKLSEKQYLLARSFYLAIERNFLRSIGIIVKKPHNYNSNPPHEEIWKRDETEKINSRYVFNLDEVPWVIDFLSDQVTKKSERTNILSQQLKQISKYRNGTLVVCMNAEEILFVMVIFKVKDGKDVRKDIARWIGRYGTRIIYTVTKSGSLTQDAWAVALKAFQNLTKKYRRCRHMNGEDYEQPVALYVDNYSVHLNEELGHEYARKYGIFLRYLIKNASHIQQPVDQHIGYNLKRRVVTRIEAMVVHMDRMLALGQTEPIGLKKWREVICGIVVEEVQKMNDDDDTRMLYLNAWVNMGLFSLPLDGSLDDKKETLRRNNKKKKRRSQRLRDYKALKKKCFIPLRANSGQYQRRRLDLDRIKEISENYSVSLASVHADANDSHNDERAQMIQMDLEEKYKRNIEKWRISIKQDLSDWRIKIPQLQKVITTQEVLACQGVYERFQDEYDLKWLFTERLSIPMRDDFGHIRYIPCESSEWLNESYTSSDDDHTLPPMKQYFCQVIDGYKLREQGLHKFHVTRTIIESLNLSYVYNDDLIRSAMMTEPEVRLMLLDKKIQYLQEKNVYQNRNGRQKKMLIPDITEFKMEDLLQPDIVFGVNWAISKRWSIGESREHNKNWHRAFLECVECKTGMDNITYNDDDQKTQVWEILDTAVENDNEDNVIIGHNSNKRSWFLSTLYWIVSQQDFFYEIQENDHGEMLIKKLLQLIEKSIVTFDRGIFLMLIPFIEAFLLGHHYHWDTRFTPLDAVGLLRKKSRSFKKYFSVQYRTFMYCDECQYQWDGLQFKTNMIFLNYTWVWHEGNGIFMQSVRDERKCPNINCKKYSKKRIYFIENDYDKHFFLFSHQPIITELWSKIMYGKVIKIGCHYRMVYKAIFETEQGTFNTGYLLSSKEGNKRLKWVLLNTQEEELQTDVSYLELQNQCRYILFEPPPLCNICGKPWGKEETMITCEGCHASLHTDCVFRSGRPCQNCFPN